MTDSMIVEAIRAAGGPTSASAAADSNAVGAVSAAADPAAVARFNNAMETTPVPLASEVSAVWRSAQENHQGILHRIRALSQMDRPGTVAVGDLVELQYEVMNLAFQQEVVTKVADKASTAIQTLVKNQ